MSDCYIAPDTGTRICTGSYTYEEAIALCPLWDGSAYLEKVDLLTWYPTGDPEATFWLNDRLNEKGERECTRLHATDPYLWVEQELTDCATLHGAICAAPSP